MQRLNKRDEGSRRKREKECLHSCASNSVWQCECLRCACVCVCVCVKTYKECMRSRSMLCKAEAPHHVFLLSRSVKVSCHLSPPNKL